MDQYENLGCIGEGTYGVVIKCRHRDTGQLVAIKQFKETDDDEQVRKTVEREVRVLKALGHVNIVSLLDVFQASGRVNLVFEYVERTVLDCLKLQPRGLGDAPTRRIMWQLVKAVEYLHTQKVPLMHRDIKPENMLVSGEGLLKLCDFGFARPCAPGGGGRGAELSDYVATRWYRSPELLVGDRCYGPAVDVWAIGCMAVEMHTGDPLFPGDSDVDQLWLILKGMGSLTPSHAHMLSRNPYFTGMRQPAAWELEPLEVRYRKFDLPLLQFLKACLHPNPEKRASCSELLRLPYLSNVEASFSEDFLAAQAQAHERLQQRAAAAKLRKLKRKSADLEPPQTTATFSLTASAHTHMADAPRYRPAPTLQAEPLQDVSAAAPESPRAEARCAPAAQAASPDSRASAQSTHHALLQRWASGSLAGPSQHAQQQQQAPGQEQSSRFRAQHLARQHASPAAESEPRALGHPAGPAVLRAQLPLSAAAGHQLQWHLGSESAASMGAAVPGDHSSHCRDQPLRTLGSGVPSLHGGSTHAGVLQHEARHASGMDLRASSVASETARSDYSRGKALPTDSSGFAPVSEAMSISPERRQPVTGAHESTPASRDGRPCRQLRFMADMRATMSVVPEEQRKADPSFASQQSGQQLLPTKLGPLLPGKHFFGSSSAPKEGMIPAVYGSSSAASHMVVCSMAQSLSGQSSHQAQPAAKVSPQRLQPTRRLQGRQQPPLLRTQHSSTDACPAAVRIGGDLPLPAGPAPMEVMSPAGHGSRSPFHKAAAAEPAGPGPSLGRGLGHGYPLCVSGVQSTLFQAAAPHKAAGAHVQPGAGRGDPPQQGLEASHAAQPMLRRSRRKPVATRLF